MNIQQNEEADLKLIGVENSDYGRSEANPPECVRLKQKSTVLNCSRFGRDFTIRNSARIHLDLDIENPHLLFHIKNIVLLLYVLIHIYPKDSGSY